MTKEQRQSLSWLDYRAQVTGRTVAELRAEMAERARLGGLAAAGRTLSEEHKQKLSQAKKDYYAKKHQAATSQDSLKK